MLTSEDLGYIRKEAKTLKQNTAKNGSRNYKVPGHPKSYTSVTTLIKKYEPQWNLRKWIENEGEEGSKNIRNRAAAVGTYVHSANESYFEYSKSRSVYNISTDQDEAEEILKRHILFRPVLEKIDPLLIEERLYWCNPLMSMGFGGSADLIGRIKEDLSTLFFEDKDRSVPFTKLPVGSIFIADYKNWLKAKSNKGMLSKYLQAAAYSLAIEQRSNGMLNPQHGLILGTTRTMMNAFYLTPACMRWYKYWFSKMVECEATGAAFDWKTFAEFSEGYMLNTNPNWKEDGEKKWIDRPENYLAKKLWTPKIKKAEFSKVRTPYLTFTHEK